jgi:hypothetical protein
MAKVTIDIPDYTVSENKDGNTEYIIRQTIGKEYSPNYRNNELKITIHKNGDISIYENDNGDNYIFIYADQIPVIAELNIFSRKD